MSQFYQKKPKPKVDEFGVIKLHGNDYITVAARIQTFRREHEDWSVETEIIDRNDTVVIMKTVIKNESGRVIGTGFAEEVRGNSNVNTTSALENCETSSIGRALASCGYCGSEYASQEEIERAQEQQEKYSEDKVTEALHFTVNAINDNDHFKVLAASKRKDIYREIWAKLTTKQKQAARDLEQEAAKQCIEYRDQIRNYAEKEDNTAIIQLWDELSKVGRALVYDVLDNAGKIAVTNATDEGEAA